MAYKFGKLTSKPVVDENGLSFLEFFTDQDVEWHDAYQQQPRYDFYIATDDDGVVVSCEADPEHSQLSTFIIYGMSSTEKGNYTTGPGGSIYGAIFDGTVIHPKPPVLIDISDRQFFQQLSVMGLITQNEALAAVKTGEIPAAMNAFIGSLPADQQFTARMVLCGATTFSRTHPLVQAFGVGMGMSSEQVDELWIAASQL